MAAENARNAAEGQHLIEGRTGWPTTPGRCGLWGAICAAVSWIALGQAHAANWFIDTPIRCPDITQGGDDAAFCGCGPAGVH